jgi:hypothetical protein
MSLRNTESSGGLYSFGPTDSPCTGGGTTVAEAMSKKPTTRPQKVIGRHKRNPQFNNLLYFSYTDRDQDRTNPVVLKAYTKEAQRQLVTAAMTQLSLIAGSLQC